MGNILFGNNGFDIMEDEFGNFGMIGSDGGLLEDNYYKGYREEVVLVEEECYDGY